MFNRLILFVLILLLFGCSLAKPTTTGEFNISENQNVIAQKLYLLGQECWSRPSSFWKGNGYKVELSQYGGAGSRISVSSYNSSRFEAFMLIYIQTDNGNSVVTTQEGDCGYNCYKDFSSDINRWLNSDNTCKPEPK